MTSPNYKINQGTIESLYTLFITETPLYLDREKVYKLTLVLHKHISEMSSGYSKYF